MLSKLSEKLIDESALELSVGDLYQARLLVTSSFSSAILLVPFCFAWLYLNRGFSGQVFFLFITLIALMSTPFILKRSRSIHLAGIFLNFMSTITLVGFAFFDGGLNSTAMPWFPVLPLFGAFFAGKKYGLFISCILITVLLSFLYLHNLDVVPTSTIDQNTLGIMYTASAVSAVFIILFVAFSYLNWQETVHQELIKANRAKNDFLSGISHELRTPLNSIIGFSEVLRENYVGELNDRQEKFVGNIHSSGEHLLQLVNALLDISKIEAGETTCDIEKVNIHSLCTEATNMVQSTAVRKSILLISKISEIENSFIYIDKIKIKQVLLNLLSNAIKFSPENGVVLLSSSLQDNHLVITVEDEGVGVPKGLENKIFERFVQIARLENEKIGGTGLGLSISRHFVELHGGKIQLVDSSGGAKFSFTIPVKKTSSAPATEPLFEVSKSI